MIIQYMQNEQQRCAISSWLGLNFPYALGVRGLLDQIKLGETAWQVICGYSSKNPKQLLAVAVVNPKGSCYWVSLASSSIEVLYAQILAYRPRRIIHTTTLNNILPVHLSPKIEVLKQYDQWIMVCQQPYSNAQGRLATQEDIHILQQYQHMYNVERDVDDISDFKLLIEQQKIAVYEVEQQIVAILRFGMETDRLVSIGGIYTFPAYRKKGYARAIVTFAVSRIFSSGRKAYLVVDVDNTPAIALYQAVGFEQVAHASVIYPIYN